MEEKINTIKEIVSNFVDAIDYAIDIAVLEKDDQIFVNLVGENLGMLIGYHGKNIDAIEIVINLMISKKYKDTYVYIDINEYRKNREMVISKYVDNIIKQLSNNIESISLNPMSSFERKFVHNYIKKFENIESVSEGEEPNRFITLKYKVTDL